MNENLREQFEDFERRRATQQRRFFARKPKRIDNVLAQVMQRKGYAQIKAGSERDEAWIQAAGEVASATRVGALRRGVLQIEVANSLQMQELTFRKEELIAKLQTALPDAGIKQLKFRVGQVK
ncbi:MAG: DUF721 domain-containing protein [Planctomycetes bacterium]|nr:DUF721 domain-containing protein [Planctomycetota bacterium]